jgi:hypothetical protein
MKYRCGRCGWTGDVLGDKPTDSGDVECCPMCDSDDIAIDKKDRKPDAQSGD